ncbi:MULTISPECIES: 6-phosphogluconolactonase [unclassified Roseitalea]|uniref:6-phosphogluconolactonase n=1 Tax=unclassified Roseitalea TaxID=2639107 RepID=UPI00273EF4B1|nr:MULTISPECIES: 6-phosphogluconolactonase [unclassified Roseitalea]
MSDAVVYGPTPPVIRRFGALRVEIHPGAAALGAAAAGAIAGHMREILAQAGRLRMTVAAAPSQGAMFTALLAEPGIDWTRVTLFHMDEFIGLPADAPQRFARWLDRHLFDHLPGATVHRIVPEPDPDAEARRYAALLAQAPIDIVCLGIGVNGHIAFNDPPVADFDDPLDVKRVELDQVCRLQQIDDQGFATLDDVPTHALTLTIPQMMRARTLFCVVPGAHKANAVAAALTGPISTACPASILRRHDNCTVYLDTEAARNVPHDNAADRSH